LLPPGTTQATLGLQAPDGRPPSVRGRGVGLHEAGIRSGSHLRLGPPDTHALADAAAAVHGRTAPGAGLPLTAPPRATPNRRPQDNDLVLTDPLVSKRHARLLVSEVVEIVDRGSANGVLIGDGHVQRGAVGPADVIRLGDTTLQVAHV